MIESKTLGSAAGMGHLSAWGERASLTIGTPLKA